MSWLAGIFINALYALLILGAAMWLSGWVRDRIEDLHDRDERFDETLAGFLGSLARWAIIALAVIFILGRFGIETTSLAALIGAMGLAVGFALQGTLGNVAAGVMLIAFRPFDVGDYIEAAGKSGTVTAVTLFTTKLTTPDNVLVILSNGDVWGSAITNYSHYDTRRCDLVFSVAYDSDLKKTEQAIRKCIKADSRAHAEPEPFVKLTNLGDYSLDFTVRVWCDASDYWGMKFDIMRAVKDAFDKGGIEIPFPTKVEINRAG